MPVPQIGMGCGLSCSQYGGQNGDGFFGDLWSGVKTVGKGLKSIGLAPSKLAGIATAPLAAINPALGGVAFATGEALRQAGYGNPGRVTATQGVANGKKKKKAKKVKRKTKRK